jgi:hypothetical protein
MQTTLNLVVNRLASYHDNTMKAYQITGTEGLALFIKSLLQTQHPSLEKCW